MVCFRDLFRPKCNTLIFEHETYFVVLRALIFAFKAVRNSLKICDYYLALRQNVLSIVHNFPINFVKGIRNMLYQFCNLYLILLNIGKCVFRQLYILSGHFHSKGIKFSCHVSHLFIDFLKLFINLFCDF